MATRSDIAAVIRQIVVTGILVTIPILTTVALADDETDGEKAFKTGDYQTALRLLAPLAQKGDVGAQIYLGAMYFRGRGVPQDYREAAKWFRAAAEQGNSGGQTDLGIMYATGSGVPQDDVQAYMWFSLAGNAEYRDHVAERMTPDQLQSARDAATRCKESNYQNCGT